jgi:hypothetical protein
MLRLWKKKENNEISLEEVEEFLEVLFFFSSSSAGI